MVPAIFLTHFGFYKDFHLTKEKEEVCIPVSCQATIVENEDFRVDDVFEHCCPWLLHSLYQMVQAT